MFGSLLATDAGGEQVRVHPGPRDAADAGSDGAREPSGDGRRERAQSEPAAVERAQARPVRCVGQGCRGVCVDVDRQWCDLGLQRSEDGGAERSGGRPVNAILAPEPASLRGPCRGLRQRAPARTSRAGRRAWTASLYAVNNWATSVTTRPERRPLAAGAASSPVWVS